MMEKLLAIGVEKFKSIVPNYYYVDKTMFIKEVLKRADGTVLLFARPRRFGKTLMLSTFETFIKKGSDEKELFKNLAIAKEEDAVSQMNQSYVVHLLMKTARGSNMEEMSQPFAEIIANSYKEFRFLLNSSSLTNYDRDYFSRALEHKLTKVESELALQKLLALIYEVTGETAYLLIDEYDAPIEEARANGYYEEAVNFFRGFYGNAIKGKDAHFRKCLITGIMEIAKESLLSGANNLIVNSVDSCDFSSYFGFSEKETRELFQKCGREYDMEEIKKWYGGYRFGDDYLFNPWSILCYAQTGSLKPHWTNTGRYAALGALLSEGNPSCNRLLSSLLETGGAYSHIDSSIHYRNLSATNDTVISFLVASGYLTLVERVLNDVWKVKIPNNEAKNLFQREIIDRFVPKDASDNVYSLRHGFLTGDEEEIKKSLEDTILAAFSSFDFQNERNYQAMVLSLSALLFDQCIVKSEQEGGLGRCDILISPKNEGGPGIVIEIKHRKGRMSPNKLKESADTALRQIIDKDYVEELRQRRAKPMLAYGIAFSEKKASISAKRLDF